MEEKEYEFSVDFEIGIMGESLGKVNLGELKKEINKLIETHLEKQENISTYDIWQFEINKEHDVIE